MLNQTIAVGRLVGEPKIEEVDEKKRTIITLAIPRSYKNIDGIYETDFIPFTLWNGIAENVIEYCKKGDVIGIKGRIQQRGDSIELIAEKVTFLSSKKQDDENE
jgi:single-strand DNA-binding protein